MLLGENVPLHHLLVGGLHVANVTLQLGGVMTIHTEAALGLPGVQRLHGLHLKNMEE